MRHNITFKIPPCHFDDTSMTFELKCKCISLADLGGVPGVRPPYGTKFFRFRIHFCQKGPMPPNGSTPPPTGNPGSATVSVSNYTKVT